ncbi:MAG TPA: asparaginase [Candidatus Aminicenantes bacterium]|nr:asparaginase [Candidatus Aminicenantes bacterium]
MPRRLLLIHTGGTIGMVRDQASGVLKPDLLYDSLTGFIPELKHLADIQIEIPFLLDSSDLTSTHWQVLAELIHANHNHIEGVVITHGTDTLAYTASALSFMLANPPFPVILTGAQKPLSEIRSDARSNLINAVELALSEIRETAILFDHRLMRGNRTVKSHINHFDAFSSPNYPLLARVGMDIEIYHRNLLSTAGGLFHIMTEMDNSIDVYRLFPGCRTTSFTPGQDTRAVVLVAFGAGNVSLKNGNLIDRVKQWHREGRLVVILSESGAGRLDPGLYESGARLLDAGAVHGGDMTFAASITKLMFLLGHCDDPAGIRKGFLSSLAGERSE